MPSATFSHSTVVRTPADDVYRALQDPETWKGVGPIDDVWAAVHDADRLVSFRWSARAAGRTWEGTATRVDDPPAPSMALVLDSPEVGGHITIGLAANEDDSTEVAVNLVARSKGLLAGMFWGVISDALGSGLPGQVEAFGRRF